MTLGHQHDSESPWGVLSFSAGLYYTPKVPESTRLALAVLLSTFARGLGIQANALYTSMLEDNYEGDRTVLERTIRI